MKNFEEETRETYNKISEEWDRKRNYYWYPVVEFLKKIDNKTETKVLDLGCGTGRFLLLMEEIGFNKKNIACVSFKFNEKKYNRYYYFF